MRPGRPPSNEPKKVFTIVRLDRVAKEALDAEVKRLEGELGFRPTLSQTIHHLLRKALP